MIKHCVLECGRIHVITKIYIGEKAMNLDGTFEIMLM